MTTTDFDPSTLDLSRQNVDRLLDEAVAERGDDYVYEYQTGMDSCLYVHDNEDGTQSPGCIAGCVLHAAGVPLPFLRMSEGRLVDRISWLRGETAVKYLLREAQSQQDDGRSWGYAVARAREAHPVSEAQ